jgi:AraC family transcriptional regulator of adaptative response / DNA-3-methyladenine glycosylase II
MQAHTTYERARLSRDARFDGHFYVGVRTTGIYCRPICPANPPKSENVTFYPTAAAASEAGLRPCLRCRPECAPGTPAWFGTSTTVNRGLRLIAEGALDQGNVERLSDRLGVTSRHLRRLFTKHLGASPLAIAHTQRLHFAKRLIDDTSMSMHEIASVSGYGSVRRFNDTFRKTYGRAPRELRRDRANVVQGKGLTVRLSYRTPYDWASMLEFFAARAIPGVEQVADGCYSRSIVADGKAGVITLRDEPGRSNLLLTLYGASTQSLFSIVQRAREVFDLDAPIADITRALSHDAVLKNELRRAPGIRVPGAWDGFEVGIRAILGQQISVKAATTLAGRVAERYGEPLNIDTGGDADLPRIIFPGPERLMRARFNAMGLIGSRIDTIRLLSRAVANELVVFDTSQDSAVFCDAITELRGIGDWTAQYIAMRALKNPDAFPASDLGLLRAFDEAGRDRLRPAELLDKAEAWRPWRAYAARLLWNRDPGSGG